MTTETATRTYPYGLFAKLATAANAEHIGTAKKVHHWRGDNHELRYFAKLRAFEVAHLGESRFLYVDESLTPTFERDVTPEDRQLLALAGIVGPAIDARPASVDQFARDHIRVINVGAPTPAVADPVIETNPEEADTRRIVAAIAAEPTPEPETEPVESPESVSKAPQVSRVPAKPKRSKATTTPAPAPVVEDAAPAATEPPKLWTGPIQFSTLGKTLANALAIVKPAVATRTALPVLGGVRIESFGWQNVKLTATNLEISISTIIPAHFPAEFVTTLDFKQLAEAIGKIDDVITLNQPADGKTAELTVGSGKRIVEAFENEAFPVIPKPDGPEYFFYPQTLTDTLSYAAPAAATEDSRPVLAAVFVKVRDGNLTAAAADGFRLSVSTRQTTQPDMAQILIPARACRAFVKLSPDPRNDVYVRVAENQSQVTFTFTAALNPSGETVLLSRLIDGTAPDYQQIIPRQHSHHFETDRAALLKTMQAAKPIAKDGDPKGGYEYCTYIQPDRETLADLTIAVGSDPVRFSEKLPCSSYDQPPDFAISAVYLIEALQALTSKNVRITSETKNQAIVVTEGDPKFCNDLTVIMPMVKGAT